jgi:NADH-quinone oxidoreductase subunit E
LSGIEAALSVLRAGSGKKNETTEGKRTSSMAPSNVSPATGQAAPAALDVDLDPVDRILDQHDSDRSNLIAILLDVQDTLGFLPVRALRHIAEKTGVSLTEVYGIATFYKYFRLKPPGRHQFTVCLGTACHVRGAVQVLKEFERKLGIPAGDTTPDLLYGLESVNCVGACALGPVVILDGEYKGQMTAMKVPVLIRRLERQTSEVSE